MIDLDELQREVELLAAAALGPPAPSFVTSWSHPDADPTGDVRELTNRVRLHGVGRVTIEDIERSLARLRRDHDISGFIDRLIEASS